MGLGIPNYYKRDCFFLVVRVYIPLNSESSSLFTAQGLLSRCDTLGESTLLVPMDPPQFFPGSPSKILASGPFSCYSLGFLSNCSGELEVPLELQHVTRGSFRVTVESPLKLQWSRSFLVAMCILASV